MKLDEIIQKLLRSYFIIFSLIVICTTISRQIFLPNTDIKLVHIYIYMLCALIADLLSLVFYSSKRLSEKQLIFRTMLHFILLQVTLLIFANLIGFVNTLNNLVLLEVQILIIYVVGKLLVWTYDKKSADNINENLNKMKSNLNNED